MISLGRSGRRTVVIIAIDDVPSGTLSPNLLERSVSLDEDRLRMFDGEIVTQGFEEVFFVDDQICRVGSALLLSQDGVAFLVSPFVEV